MPPRRARRRRKYARRFPWLPGDDYVQGKGDRTESGPLNVGLYTGAKLDNTFLAEADLIVFCGVDPVEMIPGNWPHSAPVIVLSETPRLAWPFEPDIEIAAPVAYSANYLAGRPSASTWAEDEIGSQKTRLREIVANNATVGRSPDEIIDAAAAAVPTNARLAVDAGAHMFSAMSRWPASAPHDVLKSNGLSTMGYAVPAALASWLEQTDRPAVAITGDGGMMMSLAELSTAARLGANLTVIVLNDAALSLIDIKQQRQQRRPWVSVTRSPISRPLPEAWAAMPGQSADRIRWNSRLQKPSKPTARR